jgi:hypothetical protein
MAIKRKYVAKMNNYICWHSGLLIIVTHFFAHFGPHCHKMGVYSKYLMLEKSQTPTTSGLGHIYNNSALLFVQVPIFIWLKLLKATWHSHYYILYLTQQNCFPCHCLPNDARVRVSIFIEKFHKKIPFFKTFSKNSKIQFIP